MSPPLKPQVVRNRAAPRYRHRDHRGDEAGREAEVPRRHAGQRRQRRHGGRGGLGRSDGRLAAGAGGGGVVELCKTGSEFLLELLAIRESGLAGFELTDKT